MLVRPDEDDRPLRLGDEVAKVVSVVEVGGQPKVEHLDEPIDGSRRARATKDDGVLVPATNGVPDDPPRLLSEPAPPKSGYPRLPRMGALEGQDQRPHESQDESG